MVAFLHFQMVPKWLFVACLLHVCYICCILVTLSAFVAGSDICKFGDWGVWGVCNAGSQQRIRKVLEMMMISMSMTIVMTNYHGDGDYDDESISIRVTMTVTDDDDGHDEDDHHNDNNSGYQGVGESKVPKEGDRYAFLSLNDL